MGTPRIIIERNIPFARGVFENIASVSYLSPDEITPETMAGVEALVTRTRTRCDRNLLAGSKCRIIASATIGLDHVDADWCRQAGITVCNAPGCNAPAVAQYVFAAIIAAYGKDLSKLTIGIVGVGNVGSIVARWAKGMGMDILLCDPPREQAEGHAGFCSLDEIASKADIITIHTPYTKNGLHPTHHLLDSSFFDSLRRMPMVINAARGPIADNVAWVNAIESGKTGKAVVDCWEDEPHINRRLLELAYIATPHIAGYSREGKIRATAMALEAVAENLGLPHPEISEPMPPSAPDTVTADMVARSYDPFADTEALRSDPSAFEQLRNNYRLRREVF
ncbi:MAG: 4-phosphoerythronate dehydrogenase [Paramuribaculum sp.]|nr:4-phosphoerythronate dehydrogenase [Paramuribaculum sp.]